MRRFVISLCCSLVLLTGTAAPILELEAARALGAGQSRGAGWEAGAINRLPAAAPLAQPAPPSPSGAAPPYPLNHAFDGERTFPGSPPTNHGFEDAPYAVGTAPPNHDLQTAPSDVGTPPTNHDFATGDLTGWTTAGAPSIQADPVHGAYARLPSGASVTSDAFVVAATAQYLAVDVYYLSATSYSGVEVRVLSGAGYATETPVAQVSCYQCGQWQTVLGGLAAWRGQSVKVRLLRYLADVGVDAPRGHVLLAGHEATGAATRPVEAGGNAYARLGSGGVLTTAAFAVPADAQLVAVRLSGATTGSDQAYVHVLSGAGFATSTQVFAGTLADAWTALSANVATWRGQEIKLRVTRAVGAVGVDDVGTQAVLLPGWDYTGVPSRLEGGPDGAYASTNTALTSAAFALDPAAQQLTFRVKGVPGSGPAFYVELLTGPGFGTVVYLDYVAADPAAWQTLAYGVTPYAGQTVKLRLSPNLATILLDAVAVPEAVVPGWTPTSTDAIATGEDAFGTYVTPFKAGGALFMDSSLVSPGIVDGPNADTRYYAITYDIGYSTGNLLQVYWTNAATGQDWQVFGDAANTPTGVRTRWFWVPDFGGTTGHFWVKLAGGGRFYQLGDNVAGQQLAEPFSQQVSLPGSGVGVDTTTGGFGTQETDLAVAGNPPLVLARYYAGHSDRVGALGYRWRHSFDTRLALTPDNDAGVVFPDGAEEWFDNTASSGQPPVYAPADPRVKSTLVKEANGTYTYTTRGKVVYRFRATLELDEIEDPNGNLIQLAYDASGRLTTATAPGGRTLTFAHDPTTGRLLSVTGPGGVGVAYGYDAGGDLTSVTNAEDEVRTYAYSRHRLTQVTDENDAVVVEVELDAVNRVTALRDAAGQDLELAHATPGSGATQVQDRQEQGTTTYHFDGFGRTTHVVAPTGEVTAFFYDGQGNLEQWVDPAGGEYHFTYDDGDLTSVTDPLDRTTNVEVSPDHLPELVVDDQGTRTERAYDANGNLLRAVVDATDPASPTARPYLDRTTDYEYDPANGNLLRAIVDPADGPGAGPHLDLVTAYGYDAAGRLTSTTLDPTDAGRPGEELNLVTTYVYDGLGRLTHEVDPGGRTTRYTHNLVGQLVEATVNPANDATNPLPGPWLGLTSRWVYDGAGNLIIAQDPEHDAADPSYATGIGTEWYHDAAAHPGLPTRKYDALDGLTRYAYDADGRMVRATVDALPEPPGTPSGQELQLRTDYQYDASGRLQQTIADPTDETVPGTELNLVTRSEYDAAGRLWKVIVDPGDPAVTGDGLELTTTYTYDANGQLTGKGQPDGAAWTYQYDEVGRLIRVTDPTVHVTEYAHDRAGRRTQVVVDPGPGKLNLTTSYQYDNAGRLTQVTDPTGVKTVNVYDRAGRLTSTTLDPADPGTPQQELDITTTYAYAASGDLASVTDAVGRVTSYQYDHAGRLASVTAPGNRVTAYAYDRAGRTTETATPAGVVTRTVYDRLGRAMSVTVEPEDPGTPGAELNLVTQYQYDKAGRRTSVTNPRGFATSYGFDDAGRLTSITDAATPTPGVVSFVYDKGSRITRVVNARGYGSDFQHDAMGRVTRLEDPLDRAQTRSYNGLGQLTQLVDANGNDLRYAYDGANRLTQIAAAGGTVYAGFGYDAAGRQTAATNASGSLAYTYDAAGRPTLVSSPQGTVAYQHDKLGRRTSMTQTAAGGPARTTTYAYEAPSGDLLTIADWNSQATTFQFTDDGLLSSVARPNGVNSLFTYDAAGRLSALSHSGAGGALAAYAYTLDANGNRTQVAVTGSAVANGTETYAYDHLDRLTAATYPSGGATYAYDANGNRTSVVSGGVTTNYVHDQADQLQELRDGVGALLVDLTYDANGNRTGANADTFAYDWANRLTQATVGGTSASFAYMADGTRATKTSVGTTPYLYDRHAGLPRVVDDGTAGYVHGPAGLLAEAGASTTWALADGLGSIRARTNSSGAVIGAADWDAFGNERSSTGTGGSFGWAGEQRDAETGLTYLRARYHSPVVGRFLTPDVLAQSAPGTQGFNRYAYTGNNPASLTDPSGHGVADVFWYIASVLDCYLVGACRFQQRHPGETSDPLTGQTPRAVYRFSRSPLSLAVAWYSWPPSPGRPRVNMAFAGGGFALPLAQAGSQVGASGPPELVSYLRCIEEGRKAGWSEILPNPTIPTWTNHWFDNCDTEIAIEMLSDDALRLEILGYVSGAVGTALERAKIAPVVGGIATFVGLGFIGVGLLREWWADEFEDNNHGYGVVLTVDELNQMLHVEPQTQYDSPYYDLERARLDAIANEQAEANERWREKQRLYIIKCHNSDNRIIPPAVGCSEELDDYYLIP